MFLAQSLASNWNSDLFLKVCISYVFLSINAPFSHLSSPLIGDTVIMSFPGGSSDKESTCQCRRLRRHWFDPWVGNIPWRRKWQPIPVFQPEKFHGQRSLAGYSPQGHKESDMTERLSTAQHSTALVSLEKNKKKTRQTHRRCTAVDCGLIASSFFFSSQILALRFARISIKE